MQKTKKNIYKLIYRIAISFAIVCFLCNAKNTFATMVEMPDRYIASIKNKQINILKKNIILYDDLFYDRDVNIIKIDKLTEEQFEQICNNIVYFTSLKTIDFCNVTNKKITNEMFDELQKKYPQIDVVWIVNVGKYKLRTDAHSFWPKNKYARLTSEDLKTLKYCKHLQAIDLGHQAITDLNIFAELQDLRILILVDNKITDITPLAKLKKLEYLEVYVLNKSYVDLSPLKECTNLIDLDLLYYGTIKDVDFLLEFDKLERMYLVSCQISQQNFNKIKATYPNAEIVKTMDGNADTNGWRKSYRYHDMRDVLNMNMLTKSFEH